MRLVVRMSKCGLKSPQIVKSCMVRKPHVFQTSTGFRALCHSVVPNALQPPPCSLKSPHKATPRTPGSARGSGRFTVSCTPGDLKAAETSGRSTQMRVRPTYSNSLRRRGGHGRQCTASLRDATTAGALRPSRPEGRRLRPRAWIPEESGQVGLDKSPQVRRQGNRLRRTNDGSRRPGPASRLRYAVGVSYIYLFQYLFGGLYS